MLLLVLSHPALISTISGLNLWPLLCWVKEKKMMAEVCLFFDAWVKMGGYGYFKSNPSVPQMHVFWLFYGNKLFIIGKTPGANIVADFTKDIIIFFINISVSLMSGYESLQKMILGIQHFQYWIFNLTVMLQHAFITVSSSRTFQSVWEHFNIICRPHSVYIALLKASRIFFVGQSTLC